MLSLYIITFAFAEKEGKVLFWAGRKKGNGMEYIKRNQIRKTEIGGEEMNNKAMYNLSYGLFVLSAQQDGKDNGCIINTAGQDHHRGEQAEPDPRHGRGDEEIHRVDPERAGGFFAFPAVRIPVRAQCRQVPDVRREKARRERDLRGDAGDERLYFRLRHAVTDMDVFTDVPSATYAYYQSHIKPKPQPSAKAAKGKTIWRCRVCGYEYEGEELPKDFICPICKHPASDFEKVSG